MESHTILTHINLQLACNLQQAWQTSGRGGKVNRPGKNRNKIHGNAQSNTIRGAPPPKRDFFLPRIHKETDDTDLRRYIASKGVKDIVLALVSNTNAMFKSYKLSVPLAEKDNILQANMWPYGVCVEKWRNKTKSNGGTLSKTPHGESS